MKPCYIHSAVSISAQNTFDGELFLNTIKEHGSDKAEAIYPNYRDYISPAMLRRMATGVKMGVTAGEKALQLAALENPDAIITGTGMGCIEDTEKFLNSIINNKEEYLTPTSFIQSTHNTVGAQIALGLKCKGHNQTFVNGSSSFESALLDGQLLLSENDAKTVLVGGVDEMGKEFVDYVQLMEDKLKNGIKVPFGEGASFFVLSSNERKDAIQLLDVEIMNSIPKSEIASKLSLFLMNNHLEPESIDALVLGYNGDGFDNYYDEASTLFSNATQVKYKHLSGEFFTASAFGLYIATQILKHQDIPTTLIQNGGNSKKIETILLYNQFKGRDHSFILLQK
ncbi:beta-ketoacyl synthase chain length factor [Winogradskyella sp. A3E31]|uniref:beta-ketoacyl synthase chain length factor n=1 Tax=Winogradskyella sp. A3E31 TaxID=3349637 RepID=UPI00398B8EB1